jgi:hypothetical protein
MESSHVDTSFVLNPGEARGATLQVIRFSPPANSPLGSVFSYNAMFAQVAMLPNAQRVQTVREYSVSFQNLNASHGAPGAGNLNE